VIISINVSLVIAGRCYAVWWPTACACKCASRRHHTGKWGLRDYGVPGQFGLESTPEEYVANMVEVFRLVRDLLADDGVLFLNLGDSYTPVNRGENARPRRETMTGLQVGNPHSDIPTKKSMIQAVAASGLKTKDLVGIPWMVAFALRADGWYLRSEIIWNKPNPMPESVTDRPTKAHEQLFLFAKGQSYSRTVLFSDIEPEFIHFGSNLGLEPARLETSRLCVGLASSFFYAAQLQYDFSLPPFYSQEWEKGFNNKSGHFVSSLPAIHRMAAYSSWLLDGKTSTKEFLHQTQRAFADLRETDHLLISRSLTKGFNSPYVFIDGDKTIAVNDSGKVSKIDFTHEQIITKVPTTCKYYYDAEAIAEPLAYASVERLSQPGLDEQVGSDRVPGKTNGNMKAVARASWNGSTFDKGKTGEMKHTRGYTKPYDGKSTKDYAGGGAQDASSTKARIVDGILSGDITTRNKRSVWTVTTKPFSGAHFATFPPDLIEPCILAGSRPGDIVLDPFLGSGTTGEVAQALGREWIGCELQREYEKLQRSRTAQAGMVL